MIPSSVPEEQKGLTQIEEILIARALALATSLPRYPKDLAIIIVKVKGREKHLEM